jgi:hypothetical protein
LELRAQQIPAGPWWLLAPELAQRLERQRVPQIPVCYRLGNGLLRIISDNERLLEGFDQQYGDCEVSPASAAEHAQVECVVRRGGDPPLVLMTFVRGAPKDPASAFLPRRETRVWDSPLTGWRLAGNGAVPMLAACGSRVLIDTQRAWKQFPVDYLVSATLNSQPDLVAVHAASVAIDGAGIVLAGRSGAGKTTTSLHLAARGHGMLGDEIALIRLATNELHPFRRSVGLRSGPRGSELSAAIARATQQSQPRSNDEGAAVMRIGQLFAGPAAPIAPLRSAFFLTGFGERPSVAPFRLTLEDLEAHSVLAGNEIATLWGLTPTRRALRIMMLQQIFKRVVCWKLTLGKPAETVELIEKVVRET